MTDKDKDWEAATINSLHAEIAQLITKGEAQDEITRLRSDLATRTRELDEARAEIEQLLAEVVAVSQRAERAYVSVERQRDALHAALVPLVAQWRKDWVTRDATICAARQSCADELEAALVEINLPNPH